MFSFTVMPALAWMSQPRAGSVVESLQESVCPPPESKLPLAVPPVIEKSTIVAPEAPGIVTVSPGCASTEVLVAQLDRRGLAAGVEETDSSTASATAKAAATARPYAPIFVT